MFHDKNYVFLELILPQLPVPLTTSAEESNDESRDTNILVDTSSDELGKNLDSDDVVLTSYLLQNMTWKLTSLKKHLLLMLTGLFEHGEVYNSSMNLSTSSFANIIEFLNEMFDRIFIFFPDVPLLSILL